MNLYELIRLKVLLAQGRRVNAETNLGQTFQHDAPCNCTDCKEELSAREELNKQPEHKQAQALWVSFMKDLRPTKEEPISEFDITDNVTL